MKKEYDFSKGTRGKFFNKKAKMNLPIYLAPDVEKKIRKYAQEKNLETESLVNEMLRNRINDLN